MMIVPILTAIIGSGITIGVYEFFLPSIINQDRETDILFSLAISGMYLVALLIAVVTLGFTVFGRQWIIRLVESVMETHLRDFEKTNVSRVHSRVGYILWQLSRGESVSPADFLDEAIEITRKCYENKLDPDEDLTANLANNLAYFLQQRGRDEDKAEAVDLSLLLKNKYAKMRRRNDCLLTYGDVVLSCFELYDNPSKEIDEAIKKVNSVFKNHEKDHEKVEAERILSGLLRIKTSLGNA